jgi:uncharacterized protein YndB with AHSA1/START domain
MKNYTRPKVTEINLSRVIAASPAEVYDAWLDTKSPGGPWFGCERVILEPKIDGLFYHSVLYEGQTWAHYGRFLALDRPRRIEHTWVSEGTRGLESVVTVTLEPDGNKTKIALRHAGFPDDAFGLMHRDGWGWMLGAIEERFAGRGRG